MKAVDKDNSDKKGFINPFKNGELDNPGVDIHQSRKRTEQKLSQLKPEQSMKKPK